MNLCSQAEMSWRSSLAGSHILPSLGKLQKVKALHAAAAEPAKEPDLRRGLPAGPSVALGTHMLTGYMDSTNLGGQTKLAFSCHQLVPFAHMTRLSKNFKQALFTPLKLVLCEF